MSKKRANEINIKSTQLFDVSKMISETTNSTVGISLRPSQFSAVFVCHVSPFALRIAVEVTVLDTVN